MSAPRILLCLGLLATGLACGAQTSPAPTRTPAPATAADSLLSLSPEAAYDQALLPIAIVHRSVANWSESEAASLAVAVQQAQAFCRARPSTAYTGADLLGLARLCALGQQWPAVLEAADRFLGAEPTPAAIPTGTSPPPPSPATPRAQALAFKVEAALNLQDPTTALATGRTLLSTEPYTPLTQVTTDGLIRYLQLIQTGNALNLAGQRLDRILPLLRATGLPASPSQTVASAADTLTAHKLYTAALAAPTLLQFEANGPAAAQVVSSIEAAIPAQLSADELTLIALARRQYALLGSPLPDIPASVSLFDPTETPRVNRKFGAATLLLVFPDWCAQGVRMGPELLPFLARNVGEDLHLYGLLAQAKPPPVAAAPVTGRHPRGNPPPPANPPSPPTAAERLHGTPTLVVSADLPLAAFAATDFPLLIVTDHSGLIRFAQVAPENAFIPGSLADQVVARIHELWPVPSQP